MVFGFGLMESALLVSSRMSAEVLERLAAGSDLFLSKLMLRL